MDRPPFLGPAHLPRVGSPELGLAMVCLHAIRDDSLESIVFGGKQHGFNWSFGIPNPCWETIRDS